MDCDEKGIDHVLGLMRRRAIEEKMTPEQLMKLMDAVLTISYFLLEPPEFEPGHYPCSLIRFHGPVQQ